jgi:hypothetical protein
MASKDRDPRIHRLREIETEEVSLVDRAANKRKFAVIKREDQHMGKAKAPTVMFDDLNRAQVVKMVIAPELKATVLEGATGALERLTVLVSAVNDADEREGADASEGLPADWASEFTEIGQLLLALVEKYKGKKPEDSKKPEEAPAATGESGTVVNDAAPAVKTDAAPAAKSDDKPAEPAAAGATPAATATGDTPPDAATAPAAAAGAAPAPASDPAPAAGASAEPAAAAAPAEPAAATEPTETEKKAKPAPEPAQLTTGFADSLIAIAARLKAMAAAGVGDDLEGLVKDMNGLLGSCPGPDEAATTFAGLLNHLVTKNAGALAPALAEVAERVLVLADAVKKAEKPGDKEMKELGSIHALLKSLVVEKQAPVVPPAAPGLTADEVKKQIEAGIAAAVTPLKAELEALKVEKAALAKKLGEPAAPRASSPEAVPTSADGVGSRLLFPINYNDPLYREDLKKSGIDF